MVLGELTAGVFTIIGAIIAATVSYYTTRFTDRNDTKRLYYEHALERKFNELTRLYVALNDCDAALENARKQGVSDLEEYTEAVHKPVEEFRLVADQTLIYFKSENRDTVEKAVEKVETADSFYRNYARVMDDNSNRQDMDYSKEPTGEEVKSSLAPLKSVLKQKIDPDELKFSELQ